MNNPKLNLLKFIGTITLVVVVPTILLTRYGYTVSRPDPAPQPWRNIEGPVDWQHVIPDYNNKVIQPKLLKEPGTVFPTTYESPYSTEAIIVNSEVEVEDLVDYYGYY